MLFAVGSVVGLNVWRVSTGYTEGIASSSGSLAADEAYWTAVGIGSEMPGRPG